MAVAGTSLTVDGTISGAGTLTKTGTGTLVLTTANTYTGATTVNGGTLAITNAAALGASSAGTTVNTGATLDLQNIAALAEPITLNGGTLSASTGISSVAAPVAITGNSTMDVDGTSLTVDGTISGAGTLTKTGAGTLVLTTANTYTGATTVNGGTLKLGTNASIAQSDKVTVNGNLDLTDITGNVFIQSLAGSSSGSVVLGSIAPNGLVITDGQAADSFAGVISGTGGLTIASGTQTLTGINTYTGPTIVNPGANLIAGVQSIPGDIVNNGSFGFNQANPGTFSHDMTGTGTMIIAGSGVITLTGDNTQAGGTTIQSGASLIIASTTALSGNQLVSNNGSFGIADGITLSSLAITGTVTLTSDIYTTGAQSYDNVRLAPSSDNVTTLQTVNSDILIKGTLDATVGKIQSIYIDAGLGRVTFGDSIGSIARPNRPTSIGARIFILADILTGDTQEYRGATSIGDGTYIGKALVKGFLYDSHYQYFEYDKNGTTSKISALQNNPVYVRTLVSKDPTITFNGTVDDVADYTHTLLVAAIAENSTTGRATSTMPIINFNDSVSQSIPLYSLNAQTVAAVNLTNVPDPSAYVGQINIVGNVTTYSDQVFHSYSIPAFSGDGPHIFSVVDPNASISFLLPPPSGSLPSNVNLIFNGQTNASSFVSGITQNAALGYVPPTSAGLSNASSRSSIDGGALKNTLAFQANESQMSITPESVSGVTVSSPESVEIISGKEKKSKSQSQTTDSCVTDKDGNTKCEDI
jgi:autotransporter-associated beta strand protein